MKRSTIKGVEAATAQIGASGAGPNELLCDASIAIMRAALAPEQRLADTQVLIAIAKLVAYLETED